MHYPVRANPGKPHKHAAVKDTYEKDDQGACAGAGRQGAPQGGRNPPHDKDVAQGRQSLILMPEISLTAQSLDRFAARFGVRPAEWHSALSPRVRARTWQGVAAGEIRPDVDVDLLSEVLVSPVLARMASGNTEDLDPAQTSRSLTALVFAGAEPR